MMKTDALAEDRAVTLLPLSAGRVRTSTGAGDESTETGEAHAASSGGDSDTIWDVVDAAPPRYSQHGMAAYEFAKSVWEIAEVVAVTHAFESGVNLIWSFIAKRDKAVRARIYLLEQRLMEAHPDLVFNFHIGAMDQGASASTVRDFETMVVMYRPVELVG